MQEWWHAGTTTEMLYQATGGLDVVLALEGNVGDVFRVARFGSAPAQWLAATEQSVEALRALPQDWNGYQAPAIAGALVDSARDAVRQLASLGVPAPQVTATNSGQVQLEWHTAKTDLEIRVIGPQHFDVFYEMEGQPAKSVELRVVGVAALQALEPLLRAL
jgi:hypothetical protein